MEIVRSSLLDSPLLDFRRGEEPLLLETDAAAVLVVHVFALVIVVLGAIAGAAVLLPGICFWKKALEIAVGPDRRAGKRGVNSACGKRFICNC